MATSKKHRSAAADEQKKTLPRNVFQVGESAHLDTCVYIAQPALRHIRRFAAGKTQREAGGVLVGYTLEEFGKTHVIVTGFVEAKYAEGTPTTLTFTHEAWDYVNAQIDEKYQNRVIVGWIHTHPDFGVFLSDYDKFVHENFFKSAFQIALVVDPVRGEEGFFCWANGKLEKCPGYFIYDKTGVKLDARDAAQKKRAPVPAETCVRYALLALAAVLCACVVALALRVNALTKRLNALDAAAAQAIEQLDVRAEAAESRLDALEKEEAAQGDDAADADAAQDAENEGGSD